jgi:hypothetical protein
MVTAHYLRRRARPPAAKTQRIKPDHAPEAAAVLPRTGIDISKVVSRLANFFGARKVTATGIYSHKG